jgi:hypothetical protein
VTMAASVEEVAAVRDGLGGSTHSTCSVTWPVGSPASTPLSRPSGQAGSRSCQVTVVRVASSPGGAGRSVAAGRVLFLLPSGRADVCDLTVGGSSGVVPAAFICCEDRP